MSKMSKDGAIDVTIELEIKIGNKKIRYILIEIFWGGVGKLIVQCIFSLNNGNVLMKISTAI